MSAFLCRLTQQAFTTQQAFAWCYIMATVLYCENAPYAQNLSIGFEQTQEIDLTNNILFTPIDLLFLQFLADVSLGDCEKSTHCTQPSSTTDTAIEDLRSAIAKVKATAASKEDLAKLASKLDRLNQNFSEQPVSNKEDLPKVESNIVRVVERLISKIDGKSSLLNSSLSNINSNIYRVEERLIFKFDIIESLFNLAISRAHSNLKTDLCCAKIDLDRDINSIKYEVSSLSKKIDQHFEKLEQMLSNLKSKIDKS